MEYYSAIGRNKLLRNVPSWLTLSNTKLSESNQTQMAAYCMVSPKEHSRIGKFVGTELKSGNARN